MIELRPGGMRSIAIESRMLWVRLLFILSGSVSLLVYNPNSREYIVANHGQGRMLRERSNCRKVSMTWCCKLIYGQSFVQARQEMNDVEYLDWLKNPTRRYSRPSVIVLGDIAHEIPLQAIRVRRIRTRKDWDPVITFFCADSRSPDELSRVG